MIWWNGGGGSDQQRLRKWCGGFAVVMEKEIERSRVKFCARSLGRGRVFKHVKVSHRFHSVSSRVSWEAKQ